jgi:hypothetical protein
MPSAGIVTHEQVVRVRDITADAEQLHEVVELAVDVAADCHGRIDADDVALLDQQLARLVAQLAHLVLGDGPARAQLLDRLVEVAAACAHGAGGGASAPVSGAVCALAAPARAAFPALATLSAVRRRREVGGVACGVESSVGSGDAAGLLEFDWRCPLPYE